MNYCSIPPMPFLHSRSRQPVPTAAALCSVSRRWIFVSGVPLWSPAPLPCTPAARPGSPWRPSAPRPPAPTPLALHLWAGHLQRTTTTTTRSTGQIWLASNPYSQRAQQTVKDSSRNSDMIESLISNFQLCKWKFTEIISSFQRFPLSLDATHFPGWDEENGAR